MGIKSFHDFIKLPQTNLREFIRETMYLILKNLVLWARSEMFGSALEF